FARRRRAFLASRAGVFAERGLEAATAARLAADAREGIARALPDDDAQRWVPIGPSVVRFGQAEGRPRVTGRIRDLAVSADGRRAYAASAKGGVWYTDDAGASWSPVGAFADRARARGGINNAKTCGAILAHFGAAPADDYVLVGTGETTPTGLTDEDAHAAFTQGGVGVLAAAAPALAGVGDAVWEDEAGLALLEGAGIYRLARRPGATPGKATGADADRVVAATSRGLYIGARSVAGGAARWTWANVDGYDALWPAGTTRAATDVLWLPLGAKGRIVVAVTGRGVAYSDDEGAAGSWRWVGALGGTAAAAAAIRGRASLGGPVGGRLYVLGSRRAVDDSDVPTVWRVAAILGAAPAAVVVAGTPGNLYPGQRDYDQAITAIDADGTDRVYLGGSTVRPLGANGQWAASLWCFDVDATPALVPASRVSRVGAAAAPGAAEAGADVPGLIGNDVHADVHAVRVVRPGGAAPDRAHVWVGCDGGVFASAMGGRVNSFAARAAGLATLEPGYVAPHPTSSQCVAMGAQDNGAQVRVGDTVWEAVLLGDGGGVAFHPIRSDHLVAQYTEGVWLGRPASGFRDPLRRKNGGSYAADRESGLAAFYSGCDAVRASSSVGRLAVGTTRVWVSDDVGSSFNTWGVIPADGGVLVDARPLGTDPPTLQTVGIPTPSLGRVVQLRWASPTVLLALYEDGIVRYTEDAATRAWTATELLPGTAGGAPTLAATPATDIRPVPDTLDFYLTTVGNRPSPPGTRADTCLFYESASDTFHRTGLREALDVGGVEGPLDPAYAVVVDPAHTHEVYVGTVTGVWKGTRTGPGAHRWDPFVKGFPQATAQDLAVWRDPAGGEGATRLLRAAVQSRGVWEVRLDADEASRTYLRVHAGDDRRRFPTPMADPRRAPGDPDVFVAASPDVMVRPRAAPAAAPAWPFADASVIDAGNVPAHQLWTFQTAFRWHYPSVAADGRWSDPLGDLIELHRATLGLPAGRMVDQALWAAVVGGTRLSPAGAVSTQPAHPLAVYRAPWQSPAAMDALATEIDLLESVVPRRPDTEPWVTFREPATVDVLLHHRDTRPLARDDAFVALLWREGATTDALLASAVGDLGTYVGRLLAGTPTPAPAGWTLAGPGAGGALVRLPHTLDARMPRAVSVDVDLSGVTAGNRVLFLAVAGSSVDPCGAAPVGAPTTAAQLVRAWPYAALRMVQVFDR
ncbi:hypothetical protein, partial [Roseisolibacter sp. H3M3-2]|uniref:hypothetical protein n=1 Tax=Roseisolibacter sp. H3M3-2 TaxID=3031323 RepID=UPI0023D9C792